MEASAGTQLCEQVRWLFQAPGVPSTDGLALMLHLRSKHGPVLLEMVANIIKQPKRLVIVTGRELNSNLSSLIAQSVASGETPWRGRVARSEISETATDKAYQPSAVSSADEVAIPNQHTCTQAPCWNTTRRRTTRTGTPDSLAPANGDSFHGESDLDRERRASLPVPHAFHDERHGRGVDTKGANKTEIKPQVADGSRDDDAVPPVTDDSATVWGDCESHTSTRSDDDDGEGVCPLCRIPCRSRRGVLECPLCHVFGE